MRAPGLFSQGRREVLAAGADQDATGKRDKGEQLFIINAPREGGGAREPPASRGSQPAPPPAPPPAQKGPLFTASFAGGGAGAAPVDMKIIWEGAQG